MLLGWGAMTFKYNKFNYNTGFLDRVRQIVEDGVMVMARSTCLDILSMRH